MRSRAILLASLFVFGSYTTGCALADEVEGTDDPQAETVDVAVQNGTLAVKDTRTTTTTTTTTKDPRCAGSKVKTSCTEQMKVLDYLHQ